MTTKYKLAIIPEGWKVVPEAPTEDILLSACAHFTVEENYKAFIKAAPPLDTPPVLRWDGDELMVFNTCMAKIRRQQKSFYFDTYTIPEHCGACYSEQEARRAAEKALGFPDGLVVEVV